MTDSDLKIGLAKLLRSEKYEHSDLGDGTSVLTSLTDSTIVSLNTLGAQVVSALLSEGGQDADQRLVSLSESISKKHNINSEKVLKDIDEFVRALSLQLGTG